MEDPPEEFNEKILRTHKIEKPINNTEIAKDPSKPYCIHGNFVNGVREPILLSFALNKRPREKICNEFAIKIDKKINRSLWFLITFYLQDTCHKTEYFNAEVVYFARQLNEIQGGKLSFCPYSVG